MKKAGIVNTALKRGTFRPERMLALGFLALILIGTGLLSLPLASADGKSVGLFDSLFTATSAVCVTGLVARDTFLGWSRAGQTIILCLIQLGGVGFMVFATLIMVALGRRITLRGRMLLKESMNENSFSDLVRLTIVYGVISLSVELLGAALLAIRFIPLYGWGEGLYFSFFHAVSAFCNAGFDLMGNFSSFTSFADDPLVLLTISALIILGGLGFMVIFECLRHRFCWREFSLHTKVVLLATAMLLLSATIFFTLAEWNNPATLGGMGMGEKVLNGFFHGVTLRTAGFNSIDQMGLRDGSKLISALYMLVGASPASTGGGMKTTTLSVLILLMISVIRGRDEIQLMGRSLSRDLARRAVALVMISLGTLIFAVTALSFLEEGRYSLPDILYEGASALATVGVSSVGTPNLSFASRVILLPMMFLGRVGPMTLALALAHKRNQHKDAIKYPEEKLMIG